MGWQQVGEIPFYGSRFPYFDQLGDLIVAGGEVTVPGGKAPSAAVWRSSDAVNWERIDNDLDNAHLEGVGKTIQGRAYVLGGGVLTSQRGKQTAQWVSSGSATTKGVQIRWGSAGNTKGGNTAIGLWWKAFEVGNSAFALLSNHQVIYKKEITKGGGPWQLLSHGDPIPAVLQRKTQDRNLWQNGTYTWTDNGWQYVADTEPIVLIPTFSSSTWQPSWDYTIQGLGQIAQFVMLKIKGQNWVFITQNGLQWGVQSYPWDLPSYIHEINPTKLIWASQANGTHWLIGGGYYGQDFRTCLVTTNFSSFTSIDPFPVPIAYARACEFGGRIYVIGGENPYDQWDKYNKVWVYM